MGGKFSTYGETRNSLKYFFLILGEEIIWARRRKREDNIEIDLRETGFEALSWFELE